MTVSVLDPQGQDCLMIFARYPTPGQAKTRLIPALGAEGAVQLYRQLAEHTVGQARILQRQPEVAVMLWYTGAEEAAMRSWLGDGLCYSPQSEGDLGDRLATAFWAAFEGGCRSAIAIGTDCPELDVATLAQAFVLLQQHPLVLGPASDGGYYLIGLRQFVPGLFQGIVWSTASVLSQTVAQAAQAGLTPAYLPTLTDIDTPEDLDVWEQLSLNQPT
ncbi:MAG: glycosyltransferase [Leptolyngbyaceae cyanobacterium SM2_5_2]|nr:glycosyltransferase [Leptolyngbyaceae cyanobacterium SM2_5_2]